jgi:hypothetical protein
MIRSHRNRRTVLRQYGFKAHFGKGMSDITGAAEKDWRRTAFAKR